MRITFLVIIFIQNFSYLCPNSPRLHKIDRDIARFTLKMEHSDITNEEVYIELKTNLNTSTSVSEIVSRLKCLKTTIQTITNNFSCVYKLKEMCTLGIKNKYETFQIKSNNIPKFIKKHLNQSLNGVILPRNITGIDQKHLVENFDDSLAFISTIKQFVKTVRRKLKESKFPSFDKDTVSVFYRAFKYLENITEAMIALDMLKSAVNDKSETIKMTKGITKHFIFLCFYLHPYYLNTGKGIYLNPRDSEKYTKLIESSDFLSRDKLEEISILISSKRKFIINAIITISSHMNIIGRNIDLAYIQSKNI